jgi:DNA polymerase III delta prime subunit
MHMKRLNSASIAVRRKRVEPVSRHLSSLFPYARNSRFIGRQNELRRLKEYLLRRGEHQRRAALYGLSGVGKTQLAIEFAYIYREEYPTHAVLWLHASSEERFRNSFAEVARLCNLSINDQDQPDAMKAVAGWLKSDGCPQWLMIIDYADNVDVFYRQSNRLVVHIAECALGSFLVTTRIKKVAEMLSF